MGGPVYRFFRVFPTERETREIVSCEVDRKRALCRRSVANARSEAGGSWLSGMRVEAWRVAYRSCVSKFEAGFPLVLSGSTEPFAASWVTQLSSLLSGSLNRCLRC